MAVLNVYAHEMQRGDYVAMTREGGRHIAGWSYVQRIHTEGDTVTIRVAAGISDIDIPYNAFVPVTIERD